MKQDFECSLKIDVNFQDLNLSLDKAIENGKIQCATQVAKQMTKKNINNYSLLFSTLEIFDYELWKKIIVVKAYSQEILQREIDCILQEKEQIETERYLDILWHDNTGG